jgi:integrase/recombinase XerD
VSDTALSDTALSAPAEEYLSWLSVERGRSANTLKAYRRDLLQFEAVMAGSTKKPKDPVPLDMDTAVGAFSRWLRDGAQRSPASIARALSVIRGYYRFLLDEGLVAEDTAIDFDKVRVPLRIPKALSESQITDLLGAVQGSDPIARRDRALFEVLYGTGARVSEVVGLNLSDLAGGEGLVRVCGKGSKERLVPLGRFVNQALGQWLSPEGRGALEPKQWRRRGDAEAVFLNARGGRLSRQGIFGIVNKYAQRAGLAGQVSPHVFRHSCASHMLARGADIRVVQELLGHVSIATTQLYTKVSPEHLRAAYESAHPRAGG